MGRTLPGNHKHPHRSEDSREAVLDPSVTPKAWGSPGGRNSQGMEGGAGPTETFETHPHLALRLLTLLCIIRSGSGLSRQQWVLIRTEEGTVIASNYTWNNAAVTLTADFSKFFDHFCDSPAAWRHSNPNGPLQDAHDGITQWARGDKELLIGRDFGLSLIHI